MSHLMEARSKITHCHPMTLYGDLDLSPQWVRFDVLMHQFITGALWNHLGAISLEVSMNVFHNICRIVHFENYYHILQ